MVEYTHRCNNVGCNIRDNFDNVLDHFKRSYSRIQMTGIRCLICAVGWIGKSGLVNTPDYSETRLKIKKNETNFIKIG